MVHSPSTAYRVNGDDVGEEWPGFPNRTHVQADDDFYKPFEGDEMKDVDGNVGIGGYSADGSFPFSGLLD